MKILSKNLKFQTFHPNLPTHHYLIPDILLKLILIKIINKLNSTLIINMYKLLMNKKILRNLCVIFYIVIRKR